MAPSAYRAWFLAVVMVLAAQPVVAEELTVGITSVSTDQCPPPSVQGASGGSLTIKWAPGKIEPSVVAFTSKGTGSGGPDNGLGFLFPGTGGTGSVSGSYPGSDSGKTSTAAVYSNLSSTALLQQCAGKAGLKKMTIVAGSINLK